MSIVGACKDETGVCRVEAGACKDETGVCRVEAEVCKDEAGACKVRLKLVLEKRMTLLSRRVNHRLTPTIFFLLLRSAV